MHDLIYDKLLCLLYMDKRSVYDNIVIENLGEMKKDENNFLHELPSKLWLMTGIHSLQRQICWKKEPWHHLHYMMHVTALHLSHNTHRIFNTKW